MLILMLVNRCCAFLVQLLSPSLAFATFSMRSPRIFFFLREKFEFNTLRLPPRLCEWWPECRLPLPVHKMSCCPCRTSKIFRNENDVEHYHQSQFMATQTSSLSATWSRTSLVPRSPGTRVSVLTRHLWESHWKRRKCVSVVDTPWISETVTKLC